MNSSSKCHEAGTRSYSNKELAVSLSFEHRDCFLHLSFRGVDMTKEDWGLWTKKVVVSVSIICFYSSSAATLRISFVLFFTCLPFNWTRKGLQENQATFCLKDLNSSEQNIATAEWCWSSIKAWQILLCCFLDSVTPSPPPPRQLVDWI